MAGVVSVICIHRLYRLPLASDESFHHAPARTEEAGHEIPFELLERLSLGGGRVERVEGSLGRLHELLADLAEIFRADLTRGIDEREKIGRGLRRPLTLFEEDLVKSAV